ncbi:hypothetical protein [Brumimicrobium oceani]|uniref:HEPN domain-containing protein n=1 Tax=Brumimicrobium oceani TaxID=2100725 RepID=A0A2U2XB83_9FLAO|nr:hypothetical protein [Brumimicrobium oceani]PWH85023.1 hypothetical protein DIT68_11675 [Brumimicrobium oceani]
MSLKHAKHNKKACEFLRESGHFNDWVITTAYYSALHFMQGDMFPGSFENPINGQIKKYQNFNQYHHDVNGPSKHGLLLKLVEDLGDDDVIDAFTNLKDLCWSARYTNYCYDKEVTDLCYDSLNIIEEFCT